ncbi:hypothetical protein C8J57DRAFT_398642 [Mycena rebaudengoi]|nr:hypothetical protein C8J57DRAFT_398642 [Mycena rebaudengoi]
MLMYEILPHHHFSVYSLYFRSSKLGEENLRILEHGVPVKPPGRQYKNVAEAVIGARRRRRISHQPSVQNGDLRRVPYAGLQDVVKGTQATVYEHPLRQKRHKLAEVRGSGHAARMLLSKAGERTPLAPSVSKHAKTSAHSTPPPKASVATRIRCMACLKNGQGFEVQTMQVPGSR